MSSTDPRRTTLHAQRGAGGYWRNFMAHPEVTRLYDDKAEVFAVEVIELPAEEPGCYWGWWDSQDRAFCHVYHGRALVEMCFTYGARGEEERGRGKVLPVRLEVGALVPKPARR